MKQNFTYIILATIAATLLFTACRKDEYETPYITMTTEASIGQIVLGGSGEVIINWGDGTPKETYTFLGSEWVAYRHWYLSAIPHVINISGNNIIFLVCSSNQLTSLDLSKSTALTSLNCSGNQLTSLDMSKNTALTVLYCNNNQLTRLDLDKNTALTELYCWNNQLTNLDLSKNTTLTRLRCETNQLTSLDLSESTTLTSLNCSGNQLTSLDLSKNTALRELYCWNNQLISLDVSKNNTALVNLSCYRNLLQTDALNALFYSLPYVTSGELDIYYNPGTDACDRSIATAKGWKVK